MAQLMWVPRCLPDIESDMSAVHRVDDIWSMPAARFFAFAWRLPCYRGAMRERVMKEQRERDGAPQARQPSPGRRPAPARNAGPVTEAALSDPVMGKILSFG